MVGVDGTEEAEAFERLRLERVVEEHCVVGSSKDPDSHRSKYKGDVIEAVLEQFRYFWILKDLTYKLPT